MMSVTQRYVGVLNFRQLVKSDITPCGSFVFSGSEDGCVYVWNTETGDQVCTYFENLETPANKYYMSDGQKGCGVDHYFIIIVIIIME